MLKTTQKLAAYVSEEYMVRLANLEELELVYGTDFYQFALSFAIACLQRKGLSARVAKQKRATLMVTGQFSTVEDSGYHGEAERICAAIGQVPVIWGIKQIYLQVEAQILSTGKNPQLEGSRTADCRRYPPARGLRFLWRQHYQSDMHLASCLLNDLHQGNLALAFQSVATREYSESAPTLYYECLLRRNAPEAACFSYVVPDAIQALERLGLVERLDRSVLWTTLGTLASSEGLNLGCNVSARSFVSAAWWDEILTHLGDRPDLAQRLVLEITETSTFPEEKSALGLIRHLQLLGVRIALDDIGKEAGSLDILHKVRANIVKLDKSVLEETAEGELPARLLQGMVGICADHGVTVIVEGIDSAAKLDVALTAGAAGVQGYLIARPTLHLQALFNHVARVEDDMQTRASLTKGQDASTTAVAHQTKPDAVVHSLHNGDDARCSPRVRFPYETGFRPYLVKEVADR